MERKLISLLNLALKHQVTDIYFEQKKDNLVISMKVKGELKKCKSHSDDLMFFQYLQYRSNLDIGNYFKPQTGQFEVQVNGVLLSCRFALLNSFRMNSGVLRILNQTEIVQLSSLTLDEEILGFFRDIENIETGMILLSGPTSSGKTTALYTILRGITGKKIFSLEDPIEVVQDYMVQVQINEKQQLGYDEGIKQLMRHNPDIIMIGEIRDSVAAKMAVRCALTGHLVISSIHAASAELAIERMLELGVERTQLFDVLVGVSNQRLLMTRKNGKKGFYELMRREDIEDYVQGKKPAYIPLSEKLVTARQQGVI